MFIAQLVNFEQSFSIALIKYPTTKRFTIANFTQLIFLLRAIMSRICFSSLYFFFFSCFWSTKKALLAISFLWKMSWRKSIKLISSLGFSTQKDIFRYILETILQKSVLPYRFNNVAFVSLFLYNFHLISSSLNCETQSLCCCVYYLHLLCRMF